MKRRLLLLIIFIIFVICTITLLMIFNYVDPYEYTSIGVFTLIFTYILSFSSIICILFYFFKKIFYRWKVGINHVLSSFRQWFLLSVFFLILVFFNYYWAPMYITAILAFIVLFCLELFVRAEN